MILEYFYVSLILSILLCGLVAGLVFGFAVVVMPGISKLSDRDFLITFKNIDGIIQDKQPAFILVWVGSIAAVILTFILGTLNLNGSILYLVWLGSFIYIFGVQLPTIRFNIPLNNAIQNLDIIKLDETELALFRTNFETPWNFWNRVRTLNVIGVIIVFLLILYLV